MRISWDKYFLGICEAVAKRSHDEDTQVGCVIVDDQARIVSTGYNGFPPGIDYTNWPKNRADAMDLLKRKSDGAFQIIRPSCKDDSAGEYWDTIGTVTKYDVMLHAEINAIVHAGRSLQGCMLYCTYMPCHPCAMAAIAAGIKKIVYVLKNPRTDEKGSYKIAEDLCYEAGVELIQIKEVV